MRSGILSPRLVAALHITLMLFVSDQFGRPRTAPAHDPDTPACATGSILPSQPHANDANLWKPNQCRRVPCDTTRGRPHWNRAPVWPDIGLWLGRAASPTTTHQYLEADLAAKEAVLQLLDDPTRQGRDSTPAIDCSHSSRPSDYAQRRESPHCRKPSPHRRFPAPRTPHCA